MKKVLVFVKNHFVEVVGFMIIFILIILISYLKYFRKTFKCTVSKNVDGVQIKEKYIIKQKNNHIKTIDYNYVADLSNITNKSLVLTSYKQIMDGIDSKSFGKKPKLSYEDNKIKLSYQLDEYDIADKDSYRTARVFIKNIKSSGFKCK